MPLPRKKNPAGYILGLHGILKKGGYDIIHVHGNSATTAIEMAVARWNRVPVRIVHSHSSSCEHKRLHQLLFPLFKKSYTHGIACSKAAGQWLFQGDDFTVLRNGVNLDRFSYNETVRQEFRNQLGIKADEILLGHIGNFVELKNHRFLLDVFSKLKQKNNNYKLLMISDGPLMQEMEEKAESLGLKESVIFLGRTGQVAEYYQAMDLFLLPSVYEGLPVVLIEAQAAGLFCFVSENISKESDLTGTLEFLPISDCQIWADRIQDAVVSYKNLRKERCAKWQEKITEKGYNILKNADLMRKLYEQYLTITR